MKYTPQTLLLGIATLFAGAVPMSVSAETVVRAASEVSVTADQSIAEDYYALGNTVTLSGVQEGDVYSVAGNTTLNGSVAADFVAIGGGVHVHGPVGDDVRAVAGEVTIGESVEGDVFVIASSLNILSTATIGGDVFFFGGEAEIAGEVKGGIMGTYNTLRIDAPVAQDVDVTVGSALTLGDKAIVAGNVLYESSAELVRSPNASIEGEIIQTTPVLPSAAPDTRVLAIQFLMSLFGSLCVYLVLRRQLPSLVKATVSPLASRMVIGLLGSIALLLLSAVLIFSVLGLWIGLFGLLTLGLLLVFGYLLIPIVLGAYLWELYSKTMVVNTLSIVVGAVAYHAVLLIPVFGPVVAFLLLMLMVGSLMTKVYRFLR